jgi:hypothetical protein
MKTIFTLFASLFMSVAVFAAKNNSILTIKSVDQSDISVVLDGKRFEPNNNGVMIQGLEKGSHDIKVYREKKNGVFNVLVKNMNWCITHRSLSKTIRTYSLLLKEMAVSA